MQVQSLSWEDPLEEGMATHSSFLPGESHGQRSLVSCPAHRVTKSQSDLACTHAHRDPRRKPRASIPNKDSLIQERLDSGSDSCPPPSP